MKKLFYGLGAVASVVTPVVAVVSCGKTDAAANATSSLDEKAHTFTIDMSRVDAAKAAAMSEAEQDAAQKRLYEPLFNYLNKNLNTEITISMIDPTGAKSEISKVTFTAEKTWAEFETMMKSHP